MLDPARLAATVARALDVRARIGAGEPADVRGRLTTADQEVIVRRARSSRARPTWARAVVGVSGRPVYLRDVATIVDGAEEPNSTSSSDTGPHGERLRRRARRDLVDREARRHERDQVAEAVLARSSASRRR